MCKIEQSLVIPVIKGNTNFIHRIFSFIYLFSELFDIQISFFFQIFLELYAEQRDSIWQKIKDIQKSCNSSYLTLGKILWNK